MKFGRIYDKEDYKKAILVGGLLYEEIQRESEHEKNIDKARSKKDKGKEKRDFQA
jgi:hypothetical protein